MASRPGYGMNNFPIMLPQVVVDEGLAVEVKGMKINGKELVNVPELEIAMSIPIKSSNPKKEKDEKKSLITNTGMQPVRVEYVELAAEVYETEMIVT